MALFMAFVPYLLMSSGSHACVLGSMTIFGFGFVVCCSGRSPPTPFFGGGVGARPVTGAEPFVGGSGCARPVSGAEDDLICATQLVAPVGGTEEAEAAGAETAPSSATDFNAVLPTLVMSESKLVGSSVDEALKEEAVDVGGCHGVVSGGPRIWDSLAALGKVQCKARKSGTHSANTHSTAKQIRTGLQ
jgi:hypothetical protein